MGSRFVGLVAVTVLAGCASVGGPASDSSADFVFRSGWRSANARLDGNDLFGMGMTIAHESGDYRGRVGALPVNLSTRGDRIVGMVGVVPTAITVEDHPNALLVRGSFAGDSGLVALTDARMVGRIGTCVYDLRRRGPEAVYYEGRSNDHERRPVMFRLPADLKARPAQERAAFLSLFLIWTCGRSATMAVAAAAL
jgi:hypothetical protein